jgi:hypothetical protein
MTQTVISNEALAELASSFSGALLREGDDGYEQARMVWNGQFDRRPDLAPHTTSGVYLNFTSDVGDERVREMYGPERYAKLVALKDRFDPNNVFHLNQNIRPSSS